jgi:hypothetical protein
MGHISPRAITNIVTKGIVTGAQLDSKSTLTFFSSCVRGKMSRTPIPKERSGPRATKIGEKVHTNVWGPATPESYDGRQYFITFTDDFTWWTRVETMKRKSEALTCYEDYEA